MTSAFQGQFRPLVKRAWARHCEELNLRPDDAAVYDAWYRATLYATAGIRSTRDATPEHCERLLAVFRSLCGPGDDAPIVPQVPGFSVAQQRAFTRLVIRAWRNVQRTDPTVKFAQWFAARMRDVSPGKSNANRFDNCMCLFAVIANDEYWLDHTARAAEIRMQYLIRGKLEELSRLRGTSLGWPYVQGIHSQAALASSLEDCPAEHLRTILQILDSQVRRERAKDPVPAAG